MVKILKGSTFSLSQKISKEDSIVWLKNSNKYIILKIVHSIFINSIPILKRIKFSIKWYLKNQNR